MFYCCVCGSLSKPGAHVLHAEPLYCLQQGWHKIGTQRAERSAERGMAPLPCDCTECNSHITLENTVWSGRSLHRAHTHAQ
ncbi:hypothetical protein EYF80_031299 [Liparis tanakae]|uniref:Uncharacterized protein n=1 Tax=Liparis tanakae TaxID=230148 RepID=A0A4Z2GY96_9TELE|nr:hypothetical protein EYF80_031299 [Liparis tanakae]